MTALLIERVLAEDPLGKDHAANPAQDR